MGDRGGDAGDRAPSDNGSYEEPLVANAFIGALALRTWLLAPGFAIPRCHPPAPFFHSGALRVRRTRGLPAECMLGADDAPRDGRLWGSETCCAESDAPDPKGALTTRGGRAPQVPGSNRRRDDLPPVRQALAERSLNDPYVARPPCAKACAAAAGVQPLDRDRRQATVFAS